MRNISGGFVFAALLLVAPHAGWTADDENARLREMLHRTQEALRQAQSDNADITKAKTDTEQKLQDAGKQLDSAKSASKAAQSAKNNALKAQLEATQSAQANLQHELDDANRKLTADATRVSELFRQVAARDAELKDLRQSLAQSKAENASLESKNVALYGYAREALTKYKNKGVWAALSQKDPVLGLKEVDVENTVQEYELKFDAQKSKP